MSEVEQASAAAAAAAAQAKMEEGKGVEEVKEVKEEERVVDKEEVAGGAEECLSPSEGLTETPTETPSFKEESYKVGDLKEAEKRALEALREKVEEALKKKTFFKREKKKEVGAVVVEGEAGEVKGEEEPGEKREEEGKAEEKAKEAVPVPVLVAVPVPDAVVEEEHKGGGEAREMGAEGDAPAAAPVVEGPKEFYIWDVPIHEAGDERTDVVLLKFLRARDFKVQDAFSMLKGTIAWRRDFGLEGKRAGADEEAGAGPGAGAVEGEGDEEEALFGSLAYMEGEGRQGQPVCYDEYGALQSKDFCTDAGKVDRFFKWRVRLLERSIASSLDFRPAGPHSMIHVVDLKHNPVFFKGRHLTKKALSILQDNYPELVFKQIILNIPWYNFVSWYTAFGRMFTPNMKRKLVLVKPGKTAETLFKYIAPEHVPVKYGGLRRAGDPEFEGVDAPVQEMVVKPGAKGIIELSVDQGGSRLVWDVAVVGWEVAYGELFCPSDEKSYSVIVHKTKKVAPASEALRNSFKAPEPGKLLITIDNSASKKKKLVLYRSTVKNA